MNLIVFFLFLSLFKVDEVPCAEGQDCDSSIKVENKCKEGENCDEKGNPELDKRDLNEQSSKKAAVKKDDKSQDEHLDEVKMDLEKVKTKDGELLTQEKKDQIFEHFKNIDLSGSGLALNVDKIDDESLFEALKKWTEGAKDKDGKKITEEVKNFIIEEFKNLDLKPLVAINSDIVSKVFDDPKTWDFKHIFELNDGADEIKKTIDSIKIDFSKVKIIGSDMNDNYLKEALEKSLNKYKDKDGNTLNQEQKKKVLEDVNKAFKKDKKNFAQSIHDKRWNLLLLLKLILFV